MAFTENDTAVMENWMRRALALARRAWGRTHPNPMVGALIVEGGTVVAEGWHARSGELHAERIALNALGRKPGPDAALVVTLEPCCTHGRTGACTDAIIGAGIRRVVAGATDPFAEHAGHGYAVLRAAGVEVVSGVLERECADLNLIFNHWITRKAPFLAIKTATTLDGRIATRAGVSQWITGPEARADVMRWRRYFPAIATGSGTVLADNPRLTSRIPGEAEWCPVRFVFDRRLRLAERTDLHVLNDTHADRTIIVTVAGAAPERLAALRARGVTVWTLPGGDDTAFFAAFNTCCAAQGIPGVWLEGGGVFLGAVLKSHQADYLFHYIAPKILGDEGALPAFSGNHSGTLSNAFYVRDIQRDLFTEDILIRGHLAYSDS